MNLKLENLNFFCINIDQNGHIVNATNQDMFQIDTLLGKNLFDLINEDDKKSIHKHFFNVVNKISFQEKFQCRVSLHNTDTPQWFELTLSGIFDVEVLKTVHIIFYNIHDMQLNSIENRENHRSVVELSDKISTVFFKYDVKQEKLSFINKQIYNLIKIDSESILKDSSILFDFFGKQFKDNLIQSVTNNLDFIHVFKVQVKKSATEEEMVQKQIKVAVYKDSYYDQNNPFLNGVLMDITEQELIKEQLIESKNSTELMSKNRFSLLAKSSHEIRTPLNGILGAVDILKLKELNSDQLRWIEMIEKSSSSLLHIIDDILDFSKIDAGKLNINLEPFSFDEIIHDLQDMFSPLCSKQKMKIVFNNSLTKQYVGDAGRIKQIVTNFLSNAFKSSKDTDIIASFYEKDNQVYISVKDFGKGISQTDQSCLFQFFSQVGNNQGSGLGLSICKSLTTLMNGEIGVISDIGQGAEFWVLLPLTVSENNGSTKNITPVESSMNSVVQSTNKFLVAEDNETNLSILKNVFDHLKLNVDFVTNGQEALDKCRETKYDMIFMDCQMPIMDGLQATKNIRKKSLNEQTPIIALTAHAFDDYKEKCFLSGMTGFLSKPLRINQLSETINKYIPLDISNPEYDENSEDMVSLFRKNLHRDVQVMLQSFQQGNFDIVAEKAHSMKSASAWVNLNELSSIFKLLEQSARNNDYNKTQNYIKQLRVQIERDSL